MLTSYKPQHLFTVDTQRLWPQVMGWGEREKTYFSFYGMASNPSVCGVCCFVLPLCPFWVIGNLFHTVCTPT